MKKCSNGFLFIVNITLLLMLVVMAIFSTIGYFVFYSELSRRYPLIVVFFFCIFIVFISVYSLLRYSKCYYSINKKEIVISTLVSKKRKKWYDILRINKFTFSYTFQNECYRFNIDDVLNIGLKSDLNLKRVGYVNNDIVIVLNNDKKIWIKKGIYGKKQIREIVKNISKNKNAIIGEELIKQYNIDK